MDKKVQRYFLEMKDKENLIPSVCGIYNLTIQERGKEDPQFCKFLYHKIGEDFHWKDRLAWSISDWDNYLKNEKLKFYTAYVGDDVAGYYEYLHHDDTQEVEITYFGIFKNYFGKKLGAYLLTHALETGWKHSPKRVWVHTCTLDHPNALRNYIARGMSIYKKELVLVPA
jgi:ribosomal protein S18 acetylase RimI-like enzyme